MCWQKEVLYLFNLLPAINTGHIPIQHKRTTGFESSLGPMQGWVKKGLGPMQLQGWVKKWPKRSLCCVANKSNAAGLGGQIKQAPICFSSPKQILGKASYHHLIILVRLLSSYVKWKVIFCKYYIWWGIPRPLIWWSDKLINWYAAYIVVVSLILPRITWPHITWLYYFLSYVRIPRPLICWDKLILWWHWGGLPHLARAELAPPDIPSKFQPRW